MIDFWAEFAIITSLQRLKQLLGLVFERFSRKRVEFL
jgi:hypothetical protein